MIVLQNMVVLLIVSAIVWAVISIRRRPLLVDAVRRSFATRRARVSALVLIVYVVVAMLDSFAWRDAQHDGDGKVLRDNDGGAVLEANPRSLLDRFDAITMNFGGRDEQTFSSPFAKVEFTQSTATDEAGVKYRYNKSLEYQGKHPLGTDQVGKDVLYKAIKGVRTALIIGCLTTLVAIPFALVFGIMAGYFGKWVDDLITYFYTTLASIPWILLVIAFVLAFGRGLTQLCIIMGITSWVGLCRLVRGETMKLRESDYVMAARAIGAGSWRIQIKHILPNVMHLVVIRAVLMFSGLVLAEAVLSYLGVGVRAETFSWGAMVNQGRYELSRDPIIWWNLVAAFVFMFGLVLPANVFGDAVRDALDPRLRDA